ncbi:hypothetical protein MAP00_004858 [Monascus purpureus]|nr:hypothetical protein MAP00_004858 [Monascus purpureus]
MSNNSATVLTSSKNALDGMGELVLSSTRDPVGIKLDNSPECRLKWEALSWTDQGNHTGLNPTATVNLRFTLSSFDGSVQGLQWCKDTVGKLLGSKMAMRYQPGSLHAKLPLFQQSVQKLFKKNAEPIECHSWRRDTMPFYGGTVYDYNRSLERKTRGLLGYLSALLYRYHPRGLIHYIKNRKPGFLDALDALVLFLLDRDSTNSQKIPRQMSSNPVPYNDRFQHEGMLSKTHDAQHVHNESASNKNHGNNFHTEWGTRRTTLAIAVCAVSAVGTGVLYVMCNNPNFCARLKRRLLVRDGDHINNDRFSSSNLDSNGEELLPGKIVEGKDVIQGRHDDDTDDDVARLASIRLRFSQFGHLANAPRKRIQDLFDLEPLRFRNRGNVAKMVPVLPRAPNASVRKSFRDFYTESHREEAPSDELHEIRNLFSISHTANTSQRYRVPRACID